MFEKNMKISYLLDIYGCLLDEHILGVMKAYYYDDLSLAEIAGDEGISRQGVRHLIKKGEERLTFFEDKLGLVKLYSELSYASEELIALQKSLSCDNCHTADAEKLKSIIEIISKGS